MKFSFKNFLKKDETIFELVNFKSDFVQFETDMSKNSIRTVSNPIEIDIRKFIKYLNFFYYLKLIFSI